MFPASLLKNKAEVAHMTRTTAREIAIQLGFAAAATGEEPHDLLERFFEKEHYESLAQEDELYAQIPDERQMAYIAHFQNCAGSSSLRIV